MRQATLFAKLTLLIAALGPAALPASGACARESEPPLRVLTTLGVLADIVREVGGDRVAVEALADPEEDPHYVQPRPTLMKKARDADALVEIGLKLELWADLVADGSGNSWIRTGAPGRIVASRDIRTLELPAVLSRAHGDVHPYGNPHIWLDPVNVRTMAENVAGGLARIDPGHEEGYRKRLRDFQRRLDVALYGEGLVERIGGDRLTRLAERGKLFDYLERQGMTDRLGGWLAKALPLRGESMVTYHKTWIYFATRFGLEIPIELEEKPGIPPSPRHRNQVIEVMRQRGTKRIVLAGFYDRRAAEFIAGRTGAVVVRVPIDVGTSPRSRTYVQWMDFVLDRLLENATGSGSTGRGTAGPAGADR